MEMDITFSHRRHQGSSRATKEPRRSSVDNGRTTLGTGRRSDVCGSGNYRNWNGTVKEPMNSPAWTEEKTSSRKAKEVPMKMLVKAEMLEEWKIRQQSPGLIARLMGLDTLPPKEPIHGWGSDIRHQQPSKEHFRKRDTLEPECKDVFEILEASNIGKPKTSPIYKAPQKPEQTNPEEDKSKQDFVRSKCQHISEEVRKYRELHDATDEELVLRFLQESNPLLAKHFQDVSCNLSSPESTRITVLKSSKPRSIISGEFNSEFNKKHENYYETRRSCTRCSERCDAGCRIHSSNSSPRMVKREVGPKSDCSSQPTRIVVLKPNLGKIPTANDPFSSQRSMEGFQPIHRRHASSGDCKFLYDNRDLQKMTYTKQVSRNKVQYSGEISNIERTTRSKSKTKDPVKGEIDFRQMEITSRRGRKANSFDKAVASAILGHSGELGRSHLHVSSHSTESFVAREARRRLSKQWLMSNNSLGCAGQGPSTLAEMLALSDGENPVSNPSDPNCVGGSPLGISSRDGWKDILPGKLARSRSLPASSSFRRSVESVYSSHGEGACDGVELRTLKDVLNIPQCGSTEEPELRQKLDSSNGNEKIIPNKLLLDDSRGTENEPPISEMSIDCDEISTTDDCFVFSELSSSFHDVVSSAVDTTSSENAKECIIELTLGEHFQDAVAVECSGGICGTSADVFPSKILVPEPIEVDVCEPNDLESELTPILKDSNQPSPVSVLDPLDDGQSSPGCFERVNTDLQSLRLQLQLLRSESTSISIEGSEILSDEEVDDSFDVLKANPNDSHTYACEDGREFSYVLKILTCSGLQGIAMDEILDACHSPETPINPVAFAKLEKSYRSSAWSRSERKLLFDLVNYIVSELLASMIEPFPWAPPKSVTGAAFDQKMHAEDVWILLSKRRRESEGNIVESILDADWLNAADYSHTIGTDIEKMVRDELLDEIISEISVVERQTFSNVIGNTKDLIM